MYDYKIIVEQQRIGSILDTFEDCIRNLKELLKLREKQYKILNIN